MQPVSPLARDVSLLPLWPQVKNTDQTTADDHATCRHRGDGATCAARKAAAAAAHNKLRAARQAALAAKTRVTVVSGELYYLCSAALGAVEATDAVRCGAASELDQALASEAELLPGRHCAAEVREIFAQHGPLTFVRIGCSTHADTPKEHKLGLEYNVATIGFVHGIEPSTRPARALPYTKRGPAALRLHKGRLLRRPRA